MSMKKQNALVSKREQVKLIPYVNKPGIALSFDDSFRIQDWYKYGKDMFGYYDVKVTFNINGCHHFEGQREHNQNEIDMLLDLQTNGHEIGHHGYKHRKSTEYINEFGINRWINDEIKSLFDWMDKKTHSITKERFKKPVTYAFPHFVYNESYFLDIVPKYFKIVRGHIHEDNLISLNHTGFAPSICLDGFYGYSLMHIKKILKLVKNSGKNLIITCHSILPEDVNWDHFKFGEQAIKSGKWRIPPKIIQYIIQEASKNDLEFYTTAELAGIATFIDSNFENVIRNLLSKSPEEYISIFELSYIKELDLSNKNITNLDGIQYFVNLEKINLIGNDINDYRLLEKIPNFKK